MRPLRFLAQIAALVGAVALAAGAEAQSLGLGHDHVTPRLVAETDGGTPGSTLYVALVQTIEPHWHTYWRNPGDAGEPTTIAWTLPDGWKAGDIVWPAPKRLPVGPLMNYGYEGEPILAVPLTIPASAKPGQTAHLAAKVSMLVCADVCVPQQNQLTLDVPVVADGAPVDAAWGGRIARALAQAPKDSGLAATYQVSVTTVRLAIAGPALTGKSGADAYFYPYAGDVIDQAKPQAIDLG